jgi:hypothetical protein
VAEYRAPEEFTDDRGTAEVLRALASGMAAQVPGGIAGVVDYFRQLGHTRALGKTRGEARDLARERAGKTTTDVAEKFTYEPKSEEGQQALAGLGEGIERSKDYAMRVPGVAPVVHGLQDFSAQQPLLAAGLLAATEVAPGPKLPKLPKLPKVRAATQAAEVAALRRAGVHDPARMTIEPPGAQRITAEERQAARHPDPAGLGIIPEEAQQNVRQLARERGMSYDEALRLVTEQDAPTPPTQAVQPQGLHPLYVQAQARERGLSYDEALRVLREEEAGDAPAFNQEAASRAAWNLPEPEVSAIPEAVRNNPMALERRLEDIQRYREAAAARGDLNRVAQWDAEEVATSDALHELQGGARERPRMTELDAPEALPGTWEEFDARAQEAMRQQSMAQKLRHQKELPGVTPKPNYKDNPSLMNREAVEQFLTAAGENPDILQYGLAPPPEVRGIGKMARHFGQKAGEDISLDIERRYADDPDEAPEIEKRHGRGEVMRDRYGDPKMEEFAEGEKLRDDRGDIKTEEVELVGPPTAEAFDPAYAGAPALYGDKPVRARGGEMRIDEDGNPVYRKSRGGELYRDERGRSEMIENENYRGEIEEGERWTMSIPGKGSGELIADIYESGEPMSIDATGVGKGKGGDLLYQTILADASRGDYEIGGTSLTSDNQLRLGANVLANVVRMGVNPRETGGMTSGNANVRLRGQAEGPEVFLANVEETKHRLRRSNVEPDRVRFDGADFTVDGVVTDPKDLMKAINWEPGRKSIGQKTLMRMAFFDWLRGTAPEEAARAAASWKKHGPLFSMGGATALGAAALSGEEQNEAMQ